MGNCLWPIPGFRNSGGGEFRRRRLAVVGSSEAAKRAAGQPLWLHLLSCTFPLLWHRRMLDIVPGSLGLEHCRGWHRACGHLPRMAPPAAAKTRPKRHGGGGAAAESRLDSDTQRWYLGLTLLIYLAWFVLLVVGAAAYQGQRSGLGSVRVCHCTLRSGTECLPWSPLAAAASRQCRGVPHCSSGFPPLPQASRSRSSPETSRSATLTPSSGARAGCLSSGFGSCVPRRRGCCSQPLPSRPSASPARRPRSWCRWRFTWRRPWAAPPSTGSTSGGMSSTPGGGRSRARRTRPTSCPTTSCWPRARSRRWPARRSCPCSAGGASSLAWPCRGREGATGGKAY